VDLERKHGDIPWIPLAIPKILPNNLDHFIRYFNENAKAGVRKTHSYDEPDNDPNNKSSSWNNPYWKTLELYRGPSAEKWFGTNTIENYSVDARNIFPELYEQIFDLLPYKELFFVRFWSNIRPVGLHRDQDWTYNLPLSCRSIISDSNIDPTFYLSKTKGSLEDRQYVKLPADTNTFAFNNGAFWHARPETEWKGFGSKEENLAYNHIKENTIKQYGHDLYIVWSDEDLELKRNTITQNIKEKYYATT
jgi:hypothetical protein